jgi:hypothetical protein
LWEGRGLIWLVIGISNVCTEQGNKHSSSAADGECIEQFQEELSSMETVPQLEKEFV